MWTEASKKRLLAQQTVAKRLMLFVPPVLHCNPMVGVRASTYIYAIIKFEPMHGLALKLSKIFKECLGNYLSNTSKVTTAIKCCSGRPDPFQNIKKTVLNLMNEFLKSTESILQKAD